MGFLVDVQSFVFFQAFWDATRPIQTRRDNPVVLNTNLQKINYQTPHLFERLMIQFSRWNLRMQSQQKQDFSSIDVSHTGNHGLVQQQTPDRGPALLKLCPDFLRRSVVSQRVFAQSTA